MVSYHRRIALRKRYCSFCEKEQATVTRMIVGTFGHICNECVYKFHAENHQRSDAASSPQEKKDG